MGVLRKVVERVLEGCVQGAFLLGFGVSGFRSCSCYKDQDSINGPCGISNGLKGCDGVL